MFFEQKHNANVNHQINACQNHFLRCKKNTPFVFVKIVITNREH